MDDRDDRPSVRQVLHAATGDRGAEAKAVADRADDVDEPAAEAAVKQAHGDVPGGSGGESDLATTDDAQRAADDSTDRDG